MTITQQEFYQRQINKNNQNDNFESLRFILLLSVN